MPKRISNKTTDANKIAYHVVQAATSESPAREIDSAMLSRVMAEIAAGGKIAVLETGNHVPEKDRQHGRKSTLGEAENQVVILRLDHYPQAA